MTTHFARPRMELGLAISFSVGSGSVLRSHGVGIRSPNRQRGPRFAGVFELTGHRNSCWIWAGAVVMLPPFSIRQPVSKRILP